MIAAVERATARATATAFPPSFEEWRGSVRANGALPIVAVAGSRGKTTVARLLEAIFAEAGLRSATWTDAGIEVAGRRQRGELLPWSRALTRLAQGRLDVAVQELDWSTVGAVGLPKGAYPVVAVTNICANNESCLAQDETRRALRSLAAIEAAARADGALVLNGEDYAVAGDTRRQTAPAVLVGVSRDAPLVRAHLAAGGTAAWIADDGSLTVGGREEAAAVCRARAVALAHGGGVAFELHNALTAAAVALACGIPPATVGAVLKRFAASPRTLPGSFNVVPVAGATAIVDRPAPSWFLRAIVRAAAHIPSRRLLTVVGRLDGVPDDDLTEVGRLIGRAGGALVLHSQQVAPERTAAFRQGVALNDVPPLVVNAAGERSAIQRALKMVRPDDLILVLADHPTAVLRTLDRVGNEMSQAQAARRGPRSAA